MNESNGKQGISREGPLRSLSTPPFAGYEFILYNLFTCDVVHINPVFPVPCSQTRVHLVPTCSPPCVLGRTALNIDTAHDFRVPNIMYILSLFYQRFFKQVNHSLSKFVSSIVKKYSSFVFLRCTGR